MPVRGPDTDIGRSQRGLRNTEQYDGDDDLDDDMIAEEERADCVDGPPRRLHLAFDDAVEPEDDQSGLEAGEGGGDPEHDADAGQEDDDTKVEVDDVAEANLADLPPDLDDADDDVEFDADEAVERGGGGGAAGGAPPIRPLARANCTFLTASQSTWHKLSWASVSKAAALIEWRSHDMLKEAVLRLKAGLVPPRGLRHTCRSRQRLLGHIMGVVCVAWDAYGRRMYSGKVNAQFVWSVSRKVRGHIEIPPLEDSSYSKKVESIMYLCGMGCAKTVIQREVALVAESEERPLGPRRPCPCYRISDACLHDSG